MLSMTLAHLLRSEGHAKHASAGMMFGGILNLILDPLFMFAACLAVPLTAVNALIIYTMQAMGKGPQATFMAVCRQGLLNIPCLIFMNWFVGLYGMIWTQLIIETLMLPITIGMYAVTWRKLVN